MLLAPLTAALLWAAPAVPKPFTFVTEVEGLSEYALPNGLKVVLVPDSSKPTVTVNLTLFVGSRHEGYGEKGMAHLLEHLLFKGTPKTPDAKQAISDHGADANGSTWFDRTNYHQTMLANDANTGSTLIPGEPKRLGRSADSSLWWSGTAQLTGTNHRRCFRAGARSIP